MSNALSPGSGRSQKKFQSIPIELADSVIQLVHTLWQFRGHGPLTPIWWVATPNHGLSRMLQAACAAATPSDPLVSAAFGNRLPIWNGPETTRGNHSSVLARDFCQQFGTAISVNTRQNSDTAHPTASSM
jgi:hypothetical protein